MQTFRNFILAELFHFRFERPLPWDFRRAILSAKPLERAHRLTELLCLMANSEHTFVKKLLI